MEDGICYQDLGYQCGIASINLGLYAQAENVPKAQAFLKKKIEELRNRSDNVRQDIDDEER